MASRKRSSSSSSSRRSTKGDSSKSISAKGKKRRRAKSISESDRSQSRRKSVEMKTKKKVMADNRNKTGSPDREGKHVSSAKRSVPQDKRERSSNNRSAQDLNTKEEKLDRRDFGKNSFGEKMDCNIHMRICLNADRIKRLQLPKANSVKLNRLFNVDLTSGLHLHWSSLHSKTAFKTLFDRQDLNSGQSSNKRDAATSSHSRSARKEQVVRVNMKSLDDLSKNQPRRRGEADEKTLRGEGVNSVSVKQRLGDRSWPNGIKKTEGANQGQSSERDEAVQLDPKIVPTIGRYFLHDDREDFDYFGFRNRRENNRGDRAPRRRSVADRVDRPRVARRDRGRSPDVWTHDKFGKESEDEIAEEEVEDERRRDEHTRSTTAFEDNKDEKAMFSGQRPFYAQRSEKRQQQHQPQRRVSRSPLMRRRRSPPPRYDRNRRGGQGQRWAGGRRNGRRSRSRSGSGSGGDRGRLGRRRRRSSSSGEEDGKDKRERERKTPVKSHKKSSDSDETDGKERRTKRGGGKDDKRESKAVEEDLIEQSKACLEAADETNKTNALANLDIDLLNKLTQNV